jgi:hypothetical protein
VIAADYLPQHAIHCNQSDVTNCEDSGLFSDVLGEVGRILNFSYSVDRDPDNNFGIIPVQGNWHDENATFEGVLGELVLGNYEICGSFWIANWDRFGWMDMTFHAIETQIGILINIDSIESNDLSLFLRPFNLPARITIFIFLILFLLCFGLFSHNFGRKGSSSQGKRFYIFTLWLFFILIHTYYSGAMTMFFSTTPTLPFSTMDEGLSLYPKWKMISTAGNKILYHPLADAGHGHFEQYLVMSELDDSLVFPNFDSLIPMFKERNTFGHINLNMLSYHLHKNPSLTKGMKLANVLDNWPTLNSFSLRKYSPLTKPFNQGKS